MKLRRSRVEYSLALVLAILPGLASRAFRDDIPVLFGRYAGDTLWASALYLGLALLRPCARVRTLAAAAASISLLIELSQLWKPLWLEHLRQTRLGGLVLGFDFIASDLVCYAAGIAIAALLDDWLRRRAPS